MTKLEKYKQALLEYQAANEAWKTVLEAQRLAIARADIAENTVWTTERAMKQALEELSEELTRV